MHLNTDGLNSGIEPELTEAHEINVTPFIDVMLVLLIIFMVAAPLATVNMPVDLPASVGQQSTPPEPIYLTLQQDLTLSVDDQITTRAELPQVLADATDNNPERRLYLRADKLVSYGDLMTVMNALQSAGYLKIALVGLDTVTEPNR